MNKQHGQVSLILIVFVIVLITLYSFSYNDYNKNPPQINSSAGNNAPVYNSAKGCQKYEDPLVTYHGPSYITGVSGGKRGDDTLTQIQKDNFIDPSDLIDYKLIITQVPVRLGHLVGQSAFEDANPEIANLPLGKDFPVYQIIKKGSQKYAVVYPARHGEIHYNEPNNAIRQLGLPKISVAEYGIIFLVYLDDNNNAILVDPEVRLKNRLKNQLYVMTDVYQNPSKDPLPDAAVQECQGLIKKGGTPDPEDTPEPDDLTDPSLINTEGNALEAALSAALRITYPDQVISPDKNQLQLQYFLFKQGNPSSSIKITGAVGAWNIHCKPAIYLYPEKPTQVNVKVNTKGFLTYTDPLYPEKTGWNVLANPNGDINNLSPHTSDIYPYLYYESKVPDELINKPTSGFTVEFGKLPMLYQTLLPKLGLDDKQTKDFTDYWTKSLPYSTYYYVGIMDQANIDEFEPLDITPKPDTNIRVRLYFQALEEKPQIGLNEFSKPLPPTPQKNGFSMIEWGGMVKLDKNHPFTCSQ